jgi:hypothetical protein
VRETPAVQDANWLRATDVVLPTVIVVYEVIDLGMQWDNNQLAAYTIANSSKRQQPTKHLVGEQETQRILRGGET